MKTWLEFWDGQLNFAGLIFILRLCSYYATCLHHGGDIRKKRSKYSCIWKLLTNQIFSLISLILRYLSLFLWKQTGRNYTRMWNNPYQIIFWRRGETSHTCIDLYMTIIPETRWQGDLIMVSEYSSTENQSCGTLINKTRLRYCCLGPNLLILKNQQK